MSSEQIPVRRNGFLSAVEIVVLLVLATAAVGEAAVIRSLWSRDSGFEARMISAEERVKELEQKSDKARQVVRELESRELVRNGESIARQTFADELAKAAPGSRTIAVAYVAAGCAKALEKGTQDRCRRVTWVRDVFTQYLMPPDSLRSIGVHHPTLLVLVVLDGDHSQRDLIEAAIDQYGSFDGFVTLLDDTKPR